MISNQDPNRQSQEVIFSRKLNRPNRPSLNFKTAVVSQSKTHRNLVVVLNTELAFQEHLEDKLSKISKAIGLILTILPLLMILSLKYKY